MIGAAVGRFLISDTSSTVENMERNSSSDCGHVHKRSKLSHVAPSKPTVTVLDPSIFFAGQSDTAYQIETTAIESTVKSASIEISQTSIHLQKRNISSNDHLQFSNVCEPQYWVRIDQWPYRFSIAATHSWHTVLKRVFRDLKVAAVLPIISFHDSMKNHQNLTVYVRLTSAAAVALALQHPIVMWASIFSVIDLRNMGFENVEIGSIELSPVGILECYLAERLLPSIKNVTADNDKRNATSACTLDDLSDSQWSTVCQFFQCQIDILKSQLHCEDGHDREFAAQFARWSHPFHLANILRDLFCKSSNTSSQKQTAKGCIPLVSEQTFINQLQSFRRHNHTASQTWALTGAVSSLSSNLTESDRILCAKKRLPNSEYFDEQEHCESVKMACRDIFSVVQYLLSTSSSVTTSETATAAATAAATAPPPSPFSLLQGILLQWMGLWQNIDVLSQKRLLRLRQVQQFVPHYKAQQQLQDQAL